MSTPIATQNFHLLPGANSRSSSPFTPQVSSRPHRRINEVILRVGDYEVPLLHNKPAKHRSKLDREATWSSWRTRARKGEPLITAFQERLTRAERKQESRA